MNGLCGNCCGVRDCESGYQRMLRIDLASASCPEGDFLFKILNIGNLVNQQHLNVIKTTYR